MAAPQIPDHGRRDRQEGNAAGERTDERQAHGGEQNEQQNPDEEHLPTNTVAASPRGYQGSPALMRQNAASGVHALNDHFRTIKRYLIMLVVFYREPHALQTAI
jgi:hypothetical protein